MPPLTGRPRDKPRGALAIVLHTHMPYVEGFGTWPFGEEWLWEAMAGCYLPLLELLDAGAPLTLSLTPVLCDQLQAPGVGERFGAFVEELRRTTHEEDAKGLRAGGHERLAREVERAWGDYERALARFTERGADLVRSLAPHAQWTSAATHAVLPLLATDVGLRAQVELGVEAHRARFGAAGWRGGFWLPECAHASWLEPALADAGVRATCVELTSRFGLGAREHLRPLVGESGVTLVPIDRATMELVWSDGGYPAAGSYRDYHHHTVHHHNPWGNDREAYDPARAGALAKEHAADFVARTRERLRREGDGLPGGGLVVCALDTELFGHWWYEGIAWLEAVVEECSRQGLELVRLDDALERLEPAPLKDGVLLGGGLPPGGEASPDDGALHPPLGCEQESEASSWGKDGDLSTWSGPPVAELAFATRAAELEVLAAGARAGVAAVRELLALQASDWAFMISRGMAAPYARERFDGHRQALARALAEGPQASDEGLRNLAPYADRATLLAL
ncbi:MAG TPA: 1,4-alpha-glucan branching protein domain-containing protein [Solirubrobacteraceae bacterium]